MDVRIDHAQVWTGKRLEPLSILIAQGRITGLIAAEDAASLRAIEIIDAAGLWVLPGSIDLHTHISDGAETFAPGSMCAAAGGVTTVLDMAPFHGCVTAEQFRQKCQMAAEQCVTDFGLVAGIVVSEADLSTLAELKPLGAALFKVFMPGKPAVTPRVLWRAIQSAAASGLRMAIHAEEPACLVETVDWRDPLGFARARPVAAETSATAQILEMAGACEAPVHICHVSAARTAELIAEARGRGVDVTAEVTPHHLLLDENKFFAQGARVKTTPPLRSRQDTELLWHALADGVLDAVVSDHFLGSLQPVSQQPEQMQTAAAGIASLELSVPLLFHYGVNAGRISLARFIDALAVRPAQIAGIWPRKGEIVVGADADLVIIDPQSKRQVASLGDFSRNHSSPYLGISLTGQVQRTLVRGRTVWNGQQITVLPGWGKHQPANQH